jgi:hypothetical protein
MPFDVSALWTDPDYGKTGFCAGHPLKTEPAQTPVGFAPAPEKTA